MSETFGNPADRKISRLQVLDVIRGLAVIGMVIFHGGWDLGTFRIIDPNFLSHWAWLWFSYVVAGGFILIAGMAQAFSAINRQPPRRFWRRFAEISAAAILITAVTLVVYPQTYIFFGILHHIALASLLLAIVAPLPSVLLAVFAAVLLAAPSLELGGMFNQSWLLWLGLADYSPQTYDFVPLAPWFAMGLLGTVLARLIYKYWDSVKIVALWQGDDGAFSGPIRALVFLGRHSLAIYLLHQPILWGLTYLLANYVLTPGLR